MKRILLFALALLTCLSLVACGGTGDGNDTDADTKTDVGGQDPTTVTEEVKKDVVDDIASYKLVRGDTCSDEQKTAAVTLRKAMTEVLGSAPKLGTDYDSEKAKEILIGTTTREASINASEGLSEYDWIIKKDGDKIVIAGGSDTAVTEAVDYFISNYLDKENKTISVPEGEGYMFKQVVAFDKLSINGVDISEFSLASNSLLKEEALNDFIAKFQRSVVDHKLAFVNVEDEAELKNGHYVILDGTNTVPSDYSITVEDGNLVIRGSYKSLPIAIETFLGEYTSALSASEYDLTSADNKSYETEKLEIPYTKEMLMTLLENVYESDQVLIGDESHAGWRDDLITDELELYKEATGVYQSILGIDLGCYGLELDVTTDKRVSSFICDVVDYCAEGGIVTMSSHFANPSGNYEGNSVRGIILEKGRSNGTLEEYEAAFEELLTEGTELNKNWKSELIKDGEFLKALGDAGVSVIWRPLHESNGNWFWYCTTQPGGADGNVTLDASYLQRMWIYIYELYQEMGIDNLIWIYSPNTSSNVDDKVGGAMSPWYCYPGDEYVDMVGMDWYTSGNYEITINDNYIGLIDETRKIGALAEIGPAGQLFAQNREDGKTQGEIFNAMDLYDTLVELGRQDLKFAYVLGWGRAYGIVTMTRGDELMATDMCLDRAEVLEMFKNMK